MPPPLMSPLGIPLPPLVRRLDQARSIAVLRSVIVWTMRDRLGDD
jgi:hypothetical protein